MSLTANIAQSMPGTQSNAAKEVKRVNGLCTQPALWPWASYSPQKEYNFYFIWNVLLLGEIKAKVVNRQNSLIMSGMVLSEFFKWWLWSINELGLSGGSVSYWSGFVTAVVRVWSLAQGLSACCKCSQKKKKKKKNKWGYVWLRPGVGPALSFNLTINLATAITSAPSIVPSGVPGERWPKSQCNEQIKKPAHKTALVAQGDQRDWQKQTVFPQTFLVILHLFSIYLFVLNCSCRKLVVPWKCQTL